MENIVTYLPEYAIALFVEIIVFGSFVYFVSTNTKSEVSRRWIASGFTSIIYGLLIHLLFMVIIIIGWISNVNMETLFTGLRGKLIEFILATIGLAAIITMPTIIIGIFIAYYHFWRTGDRFIEKYWRNPKIHYEEDAKPPYLKF